TGRRPSPGLPRAVAAAPPGPARPGGRLRGRRCRHVGSGPARASRGCAGRRGGRDPPRGGAGGPRSAGSAGRPGS
ncbi:MAG: hypothetical protein ACK56I_05460, partial [bacterium]